MRVRHAWSHDVVLKAMCEGIARRKKSGLAPDFILATGDLAFSGNVADTNWFFRRDKCRIRLPKHRIFCIPGNHDEAPGFYGGEGRKGSRELPEARARQEVR